MTHKPQSRFLIEMIERGFFNQCTDIGALDDLLCREEVTAYAGFDATADSLHVGHLVTLMSMRRLAASGHRVIALVGGATSRIGDPSFRNSARQLLDDDTVDRNLAGISSNIRQVLGEFADRVTFVDNNDWLGNVGFLDFMRNVGTHFTVARMLAMDSVKSRLEENNPLSVLEFSYMMLQSADFAELARRHGCRLQLGGSDQWGNIVNGIDLARRTDGVELFGLTTKLLTTADGKKMGKTADGAVWLSADKLPPFDFWQFWRNVEDADTVRFLMMFTDMPSDWIEETVSCEKTVNAAKIALANAVTALVHGKEVAGECEAKAAALFSGRLEEPTHTVEMEVSTGVLDLLIRIGMANTKNEAKRLVEGNGVRVNGQTENDWRATFGREAFPLRVDVGKRRKALVALAS
ncbi:tyrosine--tRNA ligase [Rhizobium sp. BK176]|uniref:tyrosine--tRNA ligase n=1 Tax=Rhizobium sp. BK176 TaxID=2587071 RepID=UPI002167A7E1|nr:tyrosine--tRNA ligase [Rhizobium sp. BK176]MCS4090003.1 tyrosyl-tRNA synthetase [Rhizobium sp. BK176]